MSAGLLTSAHCPVCGVSCSESPLYRYTAAAAAAHFCPRTRDAGRNHRLEQSIRKLWQGETCVILRCKACTFTFGYPFVGGDEEFYSILHDQLGGGITTLLYAKRSVLLKGAESWILVQALAYFYASLGHSGIDMPWRLAN
jgi:hypothetical protein